MSHSENIYRLGRWIASHQPGVLRLAWADRELFLTIREGKIVSAVGPSPRRLSRLLGPGTRVDETDLMIAARRAAEKNQLPIEESIGAVKVLIQEDLAMWLSHPDRRLKLLDEEPEVGPDPNISFQHALIELILTSEDDIFSKHILPENSAVLRRHENFSKQYSALRLSEEADLVVARIDGQRSIAEILSRASLPKAEIYRLLAALTSAGILEIVPPEEKSEPVTQESPERDVDVVVIPEPAPTAGNTRPRTLPRRLVPTAAAALLLLIAVLWFVFSRPSTLPETTQTGEHWGIVVDLACEPGSYRRLMETSNKRKDVLALPTDEESSAPCWRLIWGDFPSESAAKNEISNIPKTLIHPGFKVHILKFDTKPKPKKST